MTSNELATTESTGSLTLAADQQAWNDRQLAALKHMGVEDAPAGDLDVFMHVAQRTGLDPFAKQIYMIGRSAKVRDANGNERWGTKYTIQTGIDGYRLTADRAARQHGDLLEQEDPVWCGEDGVWRDAWLDAKNPPAAARVVVLKNGRRYPATVSYAEYVQTDKQGNPTSMWRRMPANQLAKCAEAQALRKAYPNDLANLYTDEEMGQADTEPGPAPSRGGGLRGAVSRHRAAAGGAPAAEQMLDGGSDLATRLFAAFDEAGMSDPAKRLEYLSSVVGREVRGGAEVTVSDAETTLAALRKLIEQPFAGEAPADGGDQA